MKSRGQRIRNLRPAFVMKFLLPALFPYFLGLAAAADFRIDPADDSLASSLEELRKNRAAGDRSPAVFQFLPGVHRLETTIVLDDATIGDGLTLRGPATLSGGRLVTGFEAGEGGVWSKKTELAAPQQIFWEDRPLTPARLPDEGFFRIEKTGPDRRTSFTFPPETVPELPDPSSANLVFFHDWSISRVAVKSVDPATRTLTTAAQIGPSADHYRIDHYDPNPRFYLEGSARFLSKPGEWAAEPGGLLKLIPPPGQDAANFSVTVPVLPRLLEVTGGKNLTLEGLTFSHAEWTPPERGYAAGQASFHEFGDSHTREPVLPSVLVDESENLKVLGCVFEASSGGGLWLRKNVRDAAILETTFRNLGGTGLMIGETRDSEKPTSRIKVEDCLVENCGTRYFGAVGIWVGKSVAVSIVGNEVRDLPYTGISLGWQWNPRPSVSRDHRLIGNHIHHVMRQLSDGGGIYTLGAQPGSVIRENHIHDIGANAGKAESNGIFMDEGTTGLLVEKNQIHGVSRSPLRFHRAGKNTLRANDLHPAEGVPTLRFNNTPEENIIVE